MGERLTGEYEAKAGDRELIRIGSYVMLMYEGDDEAQSVRVYDQRPLGVGDATSIDSPVGKAIMGHLAGDEVVVKTGKAVLTVKILSVTQE